MWRLWAAARFLRCVRANSRARWIEITVKWCVASQVIKRCFCQAKIQERSSILLTRLPKLQKIVDKCNVSRAIFPAPFRLVHHFSPNQIQPCTPDQTAAAADHCVVLRNYRYRSLLLPWNNGAGGGFTPTSIIPFWWFFFFGNTFLVIWCPQTSEEWRATISTRNERNTEDFNTINCA